MRGCNEFAKVGSTETPNRRSKMTDATFQTNASNTKPAKALVIALFQVFLATSRAISNIAFSKRPVDCDALLAAQARRENARQSANNLLR